MVGGIGRDLKDLVEVYFLSYEGILYIKLFHLLLFILFNIVVDMLLS
jgi:hypothetical protein